MLCGPYHHHHPRSFNQQFTLLFHPLIFPFIFSPSPSPPTHHCDLVICTQSPLLLFFFTFSRVISKLPHSFSVFFFCHRLPFWCHTTSSSSTSEIIATVSSSSSSFHQEYNLLSFLFRVNTPSRQPCSANAVIHWLTDDFSQPLRTLDQTFFVGVQLFSSTQLYLQLHRHHHHHHSLLVPVRSHHFFSLLYSQSFVLFWPVVGSQLKVSSISQKFSAI